MASLLRIACVVSSLVSTEILGVGSASRVRADVSPASGSDFALRDGDTVVFLGDSITAARTYGKLIEQYTLLRYPERKVRFYNAGIGGDTAAGGLKRLERDVFGRGATVLTVAYGVNDIGWGLKADAEHKKLFLDSIAGILTECRLRNVRVYLCTTAVTAEDPDRAETGFLQKMCDEALDLARSKGEGAVDVQRGMREIQRRILKVNAAIKDKEKRITLHAADGTHLSELGQLAMAFVMLKGLGAPAEVSSAVIDAADLSVAESAGCKISDVKREGESFSFTRLDAGLPLNNGLFYALNFGYVPVGDQLNRYKLTVKNLPAERYKLEVDGRGVGTYTAKLLERGVNIASATTSGWLPGGPWDAQATLVRQLTDARHDLDSARLLAQLYLPGQPAADSLTKNTAEADAKIIELQRDAARPAPYRFVLTPTAAR
jgi:lysophospholipase L1-like esterase